MSTNTANYGLHQWAGEDKFLRTDFNTDLQKIDTGIKAAYDRAGTVEASLTNAISQKADASALAALQTTVNGKADASALTALQTTVNSKANSSTVTALQTTVTGLQSSKAEASAVTTLQTQVPLKLELGAMGSYTGDNQIPKSIDVGFKPKLVLIEVNTGMMWSSGYSYGGIFTEDCPLMQNGTAITAITSTGFTVNSRYLNDNSGAAKVYYYFCFK